MLFCTITTIQPPTYCVRKLASRLKQASGKLIVVGDKKGPVIFQTSEKDCPVQFLSLAEQDDAGFSITEYLPTCHYARKNVAYLLAIRGGASCIYETDDDNAPNENWTARAETIKSARHVTKPGWNNVYRYFSEENIWPRGLPLDQIGNSSPPADIKDVVIRCPIQQGLVNGSPDVDAIWRLVMDRPFKFDDQPSVFLPPGTWCPFNTQSTWWWPIAFPLLYVPSYCSFRMCDIWKSFIAQRCLWAMNMGVIFHAAEVEQDRNEHDLRRDFAEEVPGYLQNQKIAHLLEELNLDDSPGHVGENLRRCYQHLVQANIFPEKELDLVNAWLVDSAANLSVIAK